MGIQDKLDTGLSALKRKLTDYKIDISGREFQVLHIATTRDKYEDETVTMISNKTVTAIIKYPSDIPLYRYRSGSSTITHASDGVYLYDILPINLFTKWADKVEKFDLLVQKITDDQDIIVPIVLRISEVLGSFNTELVWKYAQAAPYNQTLSSTVQTAIDTYLAS